VKRIALASLSLAVFGAVGVAHAQTSVTLYGTIDTSITYINHAAGEDNLWSLGNSSAGNLSGSRWGLKGAEDLGGGLKAIFQLENGFNPSTGRLGQGGRMFGRQAYVGLTAEQYGSLTLGRQYDPLIDLVQGITADNYFGSAFATAGDVDNYDNSFRVNNAVKYTTPSISGLQAEVMYAFGGVAGTTGAEQSWAAAVAYNNGPLALAGGYFYANNSEASLGVRTDGWTST
jgi:predicted porin